MRRMESSPAPGKRCDPPAGAELTFRAVLLGALLSMVLAAANAYLGLRVGMTVSASIPAAVVSMAVLKALRGGGILENNLVQTSASAGEALAAGVIFTLPALVLLGTWDGFPYGPVTGVSLLGGLLGVVFSVPLRRALLGHPDLRFPEGVATAEVLKSGHRSEGGAASLLAGGILAAAVKAGQSGLGVVGESLKGGLRLGGGAVVGMGVDLSPALLAVGTIVGWRAAGWMFAGGAFAWLAAIPALALLDGVVPGAASGDAYAGAFAIWRDKVRFLGVGAMVVGGLWSVLSLWPLLAEGVSALAAGGGGARDASGRRERDTPAWILLGMVIAVAVLLAVLYRGLLGAPVLGLPSGVQGKVIALTLLLALAGGFAFSAVAGYMAGLVGSSHNPVSGVTVATLLLTSLLLVPLLSESEAAAGAAASVLVGAVVCCAAAISGDNLQDLKAGRLIGATPWKQQLMQVVGVAAGAAVVAPVLHLLYQAYGIGPALPRAGMDPAAALAAPQATLMQSLAQGVFAGDLEWAMVVLGAVLAAGLIGMDLLQVRRSGIRSRVPVLAVAVGLYLPIQLTVPIFLGGGLARLAHPAAAGGNRGLLFAAGLIAGEALAGVGLAVAFAWAQRDGSFPVAWPHHAPLPAWVGVGCMAAAALLFLRFSAPPPRSRRE